MPNEYCPKATRTKGMVAYGILAIDRLRRRT